MRTPWITCQLRMSRTGKPPRERVLIKGNHRFCATLFKYTQTLVNNGSSRFLDMVYVDLNIEYPYQPDEVVASN